MRNALMTSICLVIDAAKVRNPGEAEDWLAELMRPLMQKHDGDVLIDWRYFPPRTGWTAITMPIIYRPDESPFPEFPHGKPSVSVPLELAQRLTDSLRAHLEDWETGAEDGTYDENEGLAPFQEDMKAWEVLLLSPAVVPDPASTSGTTLPWATMQSTSYPVLDIIDADGLTVADGVPEKHAEAIVKAVNDAGEMRRLLDDVREAFELRGLDKPEAWPHDPTLADRLFGPRQT